jgi:hypothetical protein
MDQLAKAHVPRQARVNTPGPLAKLQSRAKFGSGPANEHRGAQASSSPRPIAFGVYPFTLHNRAVLDPLLHRIDGGMIRVWAAVARGRRHRICSPWHRLESLRRY